jgi:hypothetical protein
MDGRAALERYYKPGVVSIQRYALINPLVQVVGNAAILTFNCVSYGGAEGEYRWICTEVHRRTSDLWQIHGSLTRATRA